jgi:hypothetical protein
MTLCDTPTRLWLIATGDCEMRFGEENKDGESLSVWLRYQGPSVEDGTMDVHEAARNMVAFSDYVIAAAHRVYGERAKVTADVKAFRQGSFTTDLVFHVAGAAASILTATPDINGIATVVKQSLDLFVFLKGEKPLSVEHRDDRSVTVTNNSGHITQVNIESLALTLDEKAGNDAAVFIRDALNKAGVHQIEISSQTNHIISATSDDARFFHPIAYEPPVLEHTMQMGLTILEPSFKDGHGHKWTMWDGEASLQYTMDDADFIARIDGGERFGKGDILVCDVRIAQTQTGSKLKIQRTITKVHDHKPSAEQTHLELS